MIGGLISRPICFLINDIYSALKNKYGDRGSIIDGYHQPDTEGPLLPVGARAHSRAALTNAWTHGTPVLICLPVQLSRSRRLFRDAVWRRAWTLLTHPIGIIRIRRSSLVTVIIAMHGPLSRNNGTLMMSTLLST